jgi:lysophospholipase L1-like esterase
MRGGRAAIRQRWFERWQGQMQLEATMGQVDWPGERRVSPAEMEEFLGRLRTAVEASGAELVVVLMPRDLEYERANPVLEQYTAAVRNFADSAGVELVDAHAAFRAGAPTLFLAGDVVHPSPEGHALIARGLADRIEALAPAGASH